jgi:hypothetical protein
MRDMMRSIRRVARQTAIARAIEGRRKMLTTTPIETRKIMQGSAIALSRIYGGMCPHKPGSELTLAYEPPGGARAIPYARAVVLSVYEDDYKERSKSSPVQDHLAQMEGFSSASGWAEHLKITYGKSPSGKVARISIVAKVIENSPDVTDVPMSV